MLLILKERNPMSEPSISSPEATLLGVKAWTLVAGFAGGVVSLSFIKALTPAQGALAVFTGGASAVFLTPVAMHYAWPTQTDPRLEYGIAFIIGLTAMNFIPGIIKLSEIFKRDPRSFLGGGDK